MRFFGVFAGRRELMARAMRAEERAERMAAQIAWHEEQGARRESEIAKMREAVASGNSVISGITAAEIERLALLAESCGDVARTVAMAVQFGMDSLGPHGGYTTRQLLEHRVGNLYAAMSVLKDAQDVSEPSIRFWFARKKHLWFKRSRYQGSTANTAISAAQ